MKFLIHLTKFGPFEETVGRQTLMRFSGSPRTSPKKPATGASPLRAIVRSRRFAPINFKTGRICSYQSVCIQLWPHAELSTPHRSMRTRVTGAIGFFIHLGTDEPSNIAL